MGCPHKILMFWGRNRGVYCAVCRKTWERKRVSYVGRTTTQSLYESTGKKLAAAKGGEMTHGTTDQRAEAAEHNFRVENDARREAEAKLAKVVEALKVAREYIKAVEGQLVTQPNIVTKDRELCDSALAAAKGE